MPLVRAVGKKQMSSVAKRAAHISDFYAMVGRFGLPSDVNVRPPAPKDTGRTVLPDIRVHP